MSADALARPVRAEEFRYGDFDLDARTRTLRCTYFVGGHRFDERVVIGQGSASAPGVEQAAQLVFLLTGVSYYKAFAPLVIDLGTHEVVPSLRPFLLDYYVQGLGEFAYKNPDVDLSGLQIVGGKDVAPTAPSATAPGPVERPLVPFGGGLDSLVSTHFVTQQTPDAALFVVSRAGDRFEAIETPAAVTGLPVHRATRELDPTILRSPDLGFLNGHVPVTAIISAIAVLAATMGERDAVVMSNEWSASMGNVQENGQNINHQYSKSLAFERAFRTVLHETIGQYPDYFSILRPRSELWIAREFAEHDDYVRSFRSCNRAFHIDPALRLDRWCGHCDKCTFIDLILSPFLSRTALSSIFEGDEPIENPALAGTLRTLLGLSADPKPFECVGDVDECRAAVLLAAARFDRSDSPLLRQLRDELAGAPVDAERLLSPLGDHFVPEPYATALQLA